jgi:hypothetical protein
MIAGLGTTPEYMHMWLGRRWVLKVLLEYYTMANRITAFYIEYCQYSAAEYVIK